MDEVLAKLTDEADIVLPRLADARRAWLVGSGLDRVAATLVADRELMARLAAINNADPVFAYLAEVSAEDRDGGLRLRLALPNAPSFENRRFIDVY